MPWESHSQVPGAETERMPRGDSGLPLALCSVGTLQKQKFPPRHKCLPYGKDKGQEAG